MHIVFEPAFWLFGRNACLPVLGGGWVNEISILETEIKNTIAKILVLKTVFLKRSLSSRFKRDARRGEKII